MTKFPMPSYTMMLQREYLNILKWFALIAMVAFHFNNAFSYNPSEIIGFLGRLAFPIFGFVLGYNLALSQARGASDTEAKMMRLLLVFGCFAQPFYWSYAHAVLPLNIMFTLALGVFMVFRYQQYSAWFALIVLGIFVDYAWAGVLYILASYFITRRAISGEVPLHYLIGFVMALTALSLSTQSYYPMFTLVLLAIGLEWNPSFTLPRCKWIFYAVYPIQFAAIQVIQHLPN